MRKSTLLTTGTVAIDPKFANRFFAAMINPALIIIILGLIVLAVPVVNPSMLTFYMFIQVGPAVSDHLTNVTSYLSGNMVCI